MATHAVRPGTPGGNRASDLEAALIRIGIRLPAGLSLLAVLRNPVGSGQADARPGAGERLPDPAASSL